MKKAFLITATLLITLTAAFAQGENQALEKKSSTKAEKREPQVSPRVKHEQKMMKMNEVVEFTEEQHKEIKKINAVSHEKVLEVRAKYKNEEDKSAMKEEVKKIKNEQNHQIKAVMTDEQREKWKAHKKASKSAAPMQK